MDTSTHSIIRGYIDKLYAFKDSRDADSHQRPLMAEIQVAIAIEQSQTAEKMKEQINTLVTETVKLTGLTKHLRCFTIVLVVFALIQIVIAVLPYCHL